MERNYSDPQTQTPERGKLRTSVFDLSYMNAHTDRFGEETPFFFLDTVKGDSKIPLRSNHNLRTLNLKSPVLQDLVMKKSYYHVPKSAILPNNWEKLEKQPKIGDDVNPELVGTTVKGITSKLADIFGARLGGFRQSIETIKASKDPDSLYGLISDIINTLCTMEYFYSAGSLLNLARFPMHHLLIIKDANKKTFSFDRFFDKVIIDLRSNGLDLVGTCAKYGDTKVTYFNKDSWHTLLEIVRDCPATRIDFVNSGSWNQQEDDLLEEIESLFNYEFNFVNDNLLNLNYKRVAAYQLVIAHFKTNNNVDYIYDANLYRQLVQSYIDEFIPNAEHTFEWNGVNCYYDAFSSHYFIKMYEYGATVNFSAFALYCSLLFAFRRSLKYGDYFTGARTRPYAVGDLSVTTGPTTSVVDITKSIVSQRFLNNVNKARDYFKGIFGEELPYDYHNPERIAEVSAFNVYTGETENTGTAQLTDANSTTANFKSAESRFAFEYACKVPGVLIGLESFDIKRLYDCVIERQNTELYREDGFIPDLQFIGDQPIYSFELHAKQVPQGFDNSIFGYTCKDQSYKTRVDQCSGGFIENLPSWAFKETLSDTPLTIGPDFIRARNAELDPFYTSLTGYSLGSYWHFIVADMNINNPSRPMIKQPNILLG